MREEGQGADESDEIARADGLGQAMMNGKTGRGSVVQALRSFPAGCDWLIARWSELRRTIRVFLE